VTAGAEGLKRNEALNGRTEAGLLVSAQVAEGSEKAQ